MAVGYPINKGYLDNRIGQLVLDLRRSFDGVDRYWEYLVGVDNAEFAQTYGYEVEEVVLLKDAVAALAKLSRVARGNDTVPSADNFFFHADKLTALER